ncbi:magnesium transporter MRS2-I-like [Benincasa hispida]|uniref:magnesium transporter MRS2-I-like n=1 Tax=Benincasa hispida TaxID=102211 RepID=UPI0018FF7897|nr:magnesium transporter MRS2-I-like [Benincasa hispida]
MAGNGFVIPVESQVGSVKKKKKKQTTTKKKKNTAISRSWVSLDREGRSTILDVDKYAIMQRVQINARDLRLLDPLLSYPSTILGRERVIVLNLEHIKSIITADEVLLRDPMDENVVPIVEELQRRLPSTNSLYQGQGEEEEPSTTQNELAENEFPFEFRALEVALEAICSCLDARTRELETDTYPALDELTSKISSLNLDRVRKLKSAMTRLTNRVQKVRDELEQLLDDDDDMAELYLSRKVAGTPESGSGTPIWFLASPKDYSKMSKTSRASAITTRGENDVEELEMLLEAYFMQIESTLNKLITLREYIDDTEDYINIQLDNHRNQLIQLELFLSSGTVCLSIYSLVTAIFGMNIPYTWKEDHEHVFKWVVILTGIVCATIYVSLSSYARYKGLVGS